MPENERVMESLAFHQALIEAGVIDRFTRRVVIDATAGRPTLIYVEKYATARLLEVIPLVAKGAEVRILEVVDEEIALNLAGEDV